MCCYYYLSVPHFTYSTAGGSVRSSLRLHCVSPGSIIILAPDFQSFLRMFLVQQGLITLISFSSQSFRTDGPFGEFPTLGETK